MLLIDRDSGIFSSSISNYTSLGGLLALVQTSEEIGLLLAKQGLILLIWELVGLGGWPGRGEFAASSSYNTPTWCFRA